MADKNQNNRIAIYWIGGFFVLALLTWGIFEFGPFQSMDSPIIISDGSSHQRHKGDFHVSGKSVSIDEGKPVIRVDCKGASGAGCGVALTSGWKFEFYESNNGSGSSILHAESPTATTVKSDFLGSNFASGANDASEQERFHSAMLRQNSSSYSITCDNGGADGNCKVSLAYK